ncbi:MAG: M55 family metallopeptidase [Lachnospirales bacterium]
MKIFLSCDIEGVNGITTWSETIATHQDYPYFANRMTEEVASCCKGINEYGEIDLIYVKDAHDSARNLDHNKLCTNTVLCRGWSEAPASMMYGLDSSFDATIFTGYHSGGNVGGNSLSHTMHLNYNYIKVNGNLASEFILNYYVSLHIGVPVIMVTGDKALCEFVNKLDENIVTVETKSGVGGACISKHPNITNKEIKLGATKALQNIGKTKMKLPKDFEFEINFKNPPQGNRASFYPNTYKISDNTIGMKTNNIMEFMTFLLFVK